MNKWILLSSVIEYLVTIDFKIILSLHKHRRYHSSRRCIEELLRQIYNILRDTLSKQEMSTLISEIVAIVLQHIVGFLGEAGAYIPQKLHEKLLWQLCETEVDGLRRAT